MALFSAVFASRKYPFFNAISFYRHSLNFRFRYGTPAFMGGTSCSGISLVHLTIRKGLVHYAFTFCKQFFKKLLLF